ncbi:hypothetical protein [Francisella philomiragia]|uniref:Uncharacterized protein n=1 Tax=Francisella philomiragia TaxID=28110 RepID=A0AAW3DEJ3_9GAMM|nr:hypothetical protein [Francisella philomiragia]KFJ44124.1 hypothetical protein DR78_1967 [Francisella philomiragia]
MNKVSIIGILATILVFGGLITYSYKHEKTKEELIETLGAR